MIPPKTSGRSSPCSRIEGQGFVEPLLVDITTYCKMLGIGRTHAYQTLAAQEVKSCRIGGSRRIDVESIYAFKARLMAGQSS